MARVTRYWTHDSKDKVKAMAKEQNKLYVLEYDAAADADLCSAMTREEYEQAAAEYKERGVYAGWITIGEDYTAKEAQV